MPYSLRRWQRPADLIVSGDTHLLNLKTFHRIPIVTAAEAVSRIAQASRR